MSRGHRVAGVLILMVVALLTASCAKLSTPTAAQGAIPGEAMRAHNAVPPEWGPLVSVSSVTGYQDLVQLWFQDRDGTIRYVVCNLRTHQLLNFHVMRRTPGVPS